MPYSEVVFGIVIVLLQVYDKILPLCWEITPCEFLLK